MSSVRFSLLAACAAALGAPAFAQGGPRVVINEFQYDDSSTDDREFVELYNADTVPVDISGWVLEAHDENTPNAAYTIPAGTILQPGGFWVLGSSVVPNVNQIVGTQDLWQNDEETLELKDASGNLVDAVVYEVNKQLFAISAALRAEIGEGVWGNFSSIDGRETSMSRYRDGVDSNNNGRDFLMVPQTPGASNNRPNLLPYVENFDLMTPGQDVPLWGASFVNARAIDPTQNANGNPNIIPASPSGGNAFLCWDPTGGGNAGMLVTDVAKNVVFECYAYFDAIPEPTGASGPEYETWAIGVQGSVETYFNSPDLGGQGTTGFTADGCTGVALMYQCTVAGGMLYLVDLNDGGWGPNAVTQARILGSIPVVQGVNDGWQRIRLQAGSDMAEAFFGGTFGNLDGTRLAGRIDEGHVGGIWVGYREFLVNNGSARPPTLDFVIIRDGNADVSFLGAATPNSVATPSIRTTGLPTIGDANFAIAMSGLAPNSPVLTLLGFSEFSPALNLELLGGQPGSRAYVNSAVSLLLAANANGELSLPLALAASPNLVGAPLFAQGIEVDRALSYGLPIAQTEGMHLTIGN